jgi:hypothetical protein
VTSIGPVTEIDPETGIGLAAITGTGLLLSFVTVTGADGRLPWASADAAVSAPMAI